MFISINEEFVMDGVVEALRAAGEPTRLRILSLLSQGEMAAGELSTVLNQSQPRVSRHLKLLVEAGLLERRPEGAWVFFRLARDTSYARIASAALKEVPSSDFVIARDRERVEQVRSQRDAQAQAYFEAAAEEWETLRKLHQPEAALEQALLASIAGKSFDLHLDLGSGTGRIIELLAPAAARAEGVDTNRKMLAMARSRLDSQGDGRASVRMGDILSLPYSDCAADLITIHQVLHFLPQADKAVLEAARVLKPGGTLLIADFAPHTFEQLRQDHAHLRLGFSQEEVKAYCEAAGLQVSHVEQIDPKSGEEGLSVLVWRAEKPSLAAQDTIMKKRNVA
jgi:ubiquinone/menaquinone biosynthesis C-methylase UbiE